MFCPVNERRFSDLAASLQDAATARHIPYMGAFELTFRCNLSCAHCYCNLPRDDRRKADELTTGEVKRVLDEAADAGCLWLLLTGGEVMVREDFWEIYEYALRKGMLVDVFTNATLIDEKAASRFADLPPLGLEISFYGSCPAVHDRITRSPGSFEKTMAGIRHLQKAGVGFGLKTILMTLNLADLRGMQALVKDLGVAFHYDTLISPRLDGGRGPARFRLSAGEMASIDLTEDGEACDKIFAAWWGKKPKGPITCGSGVFAFNVDPYGILSPCTMFRSFRHSLRELSFAEAWRRVADEFDACKEAFTPPECRSCPLIFLCANCPAWAELEAGDRTRKVDYICDYVKTLERRFYKEREVGYAEKGV